MVVQRHRLEVRRLRADIDGEHLVAQSIGRYADRRADREENSAQQQPLAAARHAPSAHCARSVLISAAASLAEKTALPATKVSAPARQTFAIVSRLIPPSTWSAAELFLSRSN